MRLLQKVPKANHPHQNTLVQNKHVPNHFPLNFCKMFTYVI